MSIRLRLTLLYSAIVALTLVLFSSLLYVTLDRVMLSNVEQTLHDETQRLLINARERSGLLGLVIEFPASKVTAPTTYVQLREVNGANLQRSPSLERVDFELPLSDSARAVVLDRLTAKDTVMVDGQRLRIHSNLVTTRDGRAFIIQVARSLAEQDAALSQLRRLLIAGSLLATVLAFGIGWVLAGTALRPIDRITQTAQAIGTERDFGRRVSYDGPQDEIGRLATTFNAMLAALQAAYRQEAQALEAQRRFVADASHELRTPLTTIRGNISLLRRTPPIDEADRVAVLADMAEEAERMSRLVNDLLSLARADTGRPLRSEAVPLRPLLDDLCRNARLLEPNLEITCANDLDVAVQGDPDALKQVLLILLDNAIKFTPPGGAVRLATALRDDSVAISVEDTGIGIPAEALPHIFERFFRADSSRTGGGAGLGLAIAKTLVERQRGAITVASTPGRGSTFTIVLPRSARPPESRSPSEALVAPVA
jgi:two-component system OmpR family sensor kinase